MDWYFIVGLALASSIDNFAVGLSYGVRRVRVGIGANLVIAAICFAFSVIGIVFGEWIGEILPGDLPDIVGAMLLLLIGLRVLLLVLPRGEDQQVAEDSRRHAMTRWFTQALAIKSGRVGLLEAILLGVALSANALANAVGAGLLHMPALAIALTAAIGSLITIYVGVELGRRAIQISIGGFDLGRFGTLISGLTLVCLAVAQVW